MLLAALLFAPAIQVPLPKGFQPTAVAIADFDGDGHPDIALSGMSQRLVVLLGDGHGGFHAAPESGRAGVEPSALAVGDLDGDGRPDLAVANHTTQHLTVLLNAGGGRFTAREIALVSHPHPHMLAIVGRTLFTDSFLDDRLLKVTLDGAASNVDLGVKPYYTLTAADLDADGVPELVVPNYGRGTVSIVFDSAKPLRVQAGAPFAAAVGDLNGDGKPDICVANYSGQISDTSHDGITWVRNDGARRFTGFPERVAVAEGSARVAVGDVDGDGFADCGVSSQAGHEVVFVRGTREGPKPGGSVRTMPAPHALALADLDGDKRADLVVVTEALDEVWIFLGVR